MLLVTPGRVPAVGSGPVYYFSSVLCFIRYFFFIEVCVSTIIIWMNENMVLGVKGIIFYCTKIFGTGGALGACICTSEN